VPEPFDYDKNERTLQLTILGSIQIDKHYLCPQAKSHASTSGNARISLGQTHAAYCRCHIKAKPITITPTTMR